MSHIWMSHVPRETRNISSRWCVAVCCSVLQCVAVCCSVLQCVAAYLGSHAISAVDGVLQCVAVCCSVLQCVAAYLGRHAISAVDGVRWRASHSATTNASCMH